MNPDLLYSTQGMNVSPTQLPDAEKSSLQPPTDTSPASNNKSSGTDYLPPCRICDAVASGFHYGESILFILYYVPLFGLYDLQFEA